MPELRRLVMYCCGFLVCHSVYFVSFLFNLRILASGVDVGLQASRLAVCRAFSAMLLGLMESNPGFPLMCSSCRSPF